MITVIPKAEEEQVEVDPEHAGSFSRRRSSSALSHSQSNRKSTFLQMGSAILANLDFSNYKFESPRWLFFPATASLVVAILCGFLAYCQMLEAKPQGIMLRDADKAADIIWNPETYTPCLEQMQQSCWPQYLAAIFFGVVGLLALLEMYFVVVAWRQFGTASERGSSTEGRGSNASGTSDSSSWGEYIMHCVSKVTPVDTPFAAGSRWFWPRAWSALITEVGFQVLRGYVLYDSYARVSALQTLAQTVLIVLQIDVFLLFFYMRSEIGHVFNGFYFEIAYLLVRVWLFGPLALRTTGFWDFLTIGGPLLISVADLHEILHFITFGSAIVIAKSRDAREEQLFQRKVGMFLFTLGFLITGAGAFLSIVIFRTGFVDECPAVYGMETRPENYLLPSGVDCYVWQYNLFLAPACSCLYLTIQPYYSDVCGGMGVNNQSALENLIPHLDDVRILNVWATQVSNCHLTEKDMELFSSMRRLHSLVIDEYRLSELPESFKHLDDLRTIDIHTAPKITSIDSDIVSAWSRLERFECWQCKKLGNVSFLQEASLPRLNSVLVHGVASCEGFDTFQEDFSCTERGFSRTCPGYAEWQLQASLDSVRISRHRNDCAEAVCRAFMTPFEQKDPDNNGLLDFSERSAWYSMMGWYFNETTHNCMINAIRNELAIGYQEDYQGLPVSGIQTHIEFLSENTKYTTCADCPFVQDVFTQRKEAYELANAIDKSDKCWMITTYGGNTFSVESLREVCMIEESKCSLSECQISSMVIVAADTNYDFKYSEADVEDIGMSMAAKWAVPGIFDCFAEQVPECLDTEINGEPALSIDKMYKLGMHVVNFAKSSITNCSQCEDFPVLGEKSKWHRR